MKISIFIFRFIFLCFCLKVSRCKDPDSNSVLAVLKNNPPVGNKIDITPELEKIQTSAAEKNLKAISSQLFTGVQEIIVGASKKSFRKTLIGGLNVASGLVASFGINGQIARVVMSLVAKILSAYGDIADNGKDPVERALENSQISNLELDVAGAKEYFENLIHPIVLEDENDKKAIATLTNPSEKPKNDIYTQSEAKQIIKNAQGKLELYGKLLHLIKKYCTGDEVEQCLKTLNIYCTLSTIHIAYLESALKGITLSIDKPNGIPTAAAEKFQNIITDFIAKRNKRDYETLRFLSDPMKYPETATIMYKLYKHRDDYEDIMARLLSLNTEVNSEQEPIFPKKVFVCNEGRLNGICRFLKPGQDQTITNWGLTLSMFIPPNMQVDYNKDTNKRFIGLGVWSTSYTNLFNIDLKTMSVTNVQQDPSDFVQACTDNWCKTLDKNEYNNDENGLQLKTLESIKVPADNVVNVVMQDEASLLIYGPFTNKKFFQRCQKVWNEIHIYKKAEFIKKETGLTKEMLDGEKMVQVCTDQNAKGFCKQMLLDGVFQQAAKWFPFLPKLNNDIPGCNVRMQSVKIPEGKRVTVIENPVASKMAVSSPYVGPVTINLKQDVQLNFVVENDDKQDPPIIDTSGKGQKLAGKGEGKYVPKIPSHFKKIKGMKKLVEAVKSAFSTVKEIEKGGTDNSPDNPNQKPSQNRSPFVESGKEVENVNAIADYQKKDKAAYFQTGNSTFSQSNDENRYPLDTSIELRQQDANTEYETISMLGDKKSKVKNSKQRNSGWKSKKSTRQRKEHD